MTIYETYGVTPIINATGYVTRLGGSLMLPEVVEAMAAASHAFVPIAELEDAASQVIAEHTGAEAGYVTSGSAAALTLAAATCIAGDNRDRINRLPATTGMPNRIVIPATHRDSYDRCFRVAGARIVNAGTGERCTPDDLDAVIDDQTVAIGWFSMYEESLPLPPVVEVARARGIPVIVDAAIALPPPENLRRFIDEGADLVAFSGGKDLRGPQTTGFLAGRRDLIAPLAMHHQDFAANDGTWDTSTEFASPGHGLGRPMKVGKEELIGLLVALQAYPTRDHAAELAAQERAVELIAEAIDGIPGIDVHTGRAQTPGCFVAATVDPAVVGFDASTAARRLADGQPRMMVGAPLFIGSERIVIGTVALRDGEAEIVARRVRDVLSDSQ